MSHAAYMSDGELLPRATTGDGEALMILVDRHAARLYSFAFQLSGTPAQAAEATAGAFTGLAGGSRPLPAADPLTALDGAVAAAVLAGLSRRAGRLRWLSRPAPPAMRPAARRDDPAAEAGAALAELTPLDRAILVLSARRGFSDATIAELLDRPVHEAATARAAAERAFTAALALRRGGADCAVLRAFGDDDRAAARRDAVAAHLATCPICAAGRLPTPAAALAALPTPPLTAEGLDDIRWRVSRALPAATASAGGGPDDPPPATEEAGPARRMTRCRPR